MKLKKNKDIEYTSNDALKYADYILESNNIKNPVKTEGIYVKNNSEHIGKFPVRQDILILGPDSPSPNIKPGTPIHIREGGEVFLHGQKDLKRLTRKQDLQPGTEIIAPTLLGQVKAIVKKDSDGELYWESDGLVGDLIFSADDRKCWTSTSSFNKKHLQEWVK